MKFFFFIFFSISLITKYSWRTKDQWKILKNPLEEEKNYFIEKNSI